MVSKPVVLITGASGGIGRSTARLLACDGWRVFGTSRDPARVEAIPGVSFVPLDIRSRESAAACVDLVFAQAGRIDVLVNNAGVIGPPAASEEVNLDQIRDLFEINFFGAVQVTNAVLPHMRAQNNGTIIFISSTGGRVAAMPFFSYYAASKHALEAYGEGLRYESRRFHIKVAIIEPGYTQTGILNTHELPERPLEAFARTRRNILLLDEAAIRYGTPPVETARAVLRVLRAKDPALYFPVGSDSAWIIALKRWLPARMFERLIDWMFFTWEPDPGADKIFTPAGLGLRRALFHRPTRDFIIQGSLAAGVLAAAVALFNRLCARPKMKP